MSSREKILHVAVELFYRNGYLATSVDDIIARAQVSKSNFYYHFKSKEDLGLRVLDLRRAETQQVWDRLLTDTSLAPPVRLVRFFEHLADTQESRFEKGGCPFGNLVAEMAEHSEKFRCHLSALFFGLSERIAEVVEEGQSDGGFRRDVDATEVATLFLHATQGMLLMTKCHKSVDNLLASGRLLTRLISAG